MSDRDQTAQMPDKLTPGIVHVLIAVKAGLVSQTFTATGNTFQVPAGCSARFARRAQDQHLIEDVKGAGRATYKQALTAKGEAALRRYGHL